MRTLNVTSVTPSPYRSFWMGGYEGADHLNCNGTALDMASANAHLQRLDDDYAAAAALGLLSVRESIGWRLAETETGSFDAERTQRIAAAAARHGLQVLWTLMHYGTPPDVSLFDDRIIERFAAFCGRVAQVVGPLSEEPPIYTPINEISFVAWAACNSNLLHPYRGSSDGSLDGSPSSNTLDAGYDVKRRLVQACLAGMRAIREVDPRARFLHVEPLVHVVASAQRPELQAVARAVSGYQWQVWDMLAGRLERTLGGTPAALDLIGVNHYHSGQWEVDTGRRLRWDERDPRRQPFADLLQAAWQRYHRPLIVAETSHYGEGRAPWLHEMMSEVGRAISLGIGVQGVCLYPLIDRPDWNEPTHWHHSGLWDVQLPEMATDAAAEARRVDGPARAADPPMPRRLCSPYAAALGAWQAVLPLPHPTGSPMPTLIVFSHLRWNFVYQRPQHLMSRLAAHYRVLFIEEPLRDDGPPRLDRQPQGPQIDVLVPHTPAAVPGFHDDQLPLLKPMLDDYLERHGIDDYLVWFYTPMPLPLIDQWTPRAVIYDCMDELSAFKDAPRQLRQRETALLKRAGLVLTGGPALYESKRHLHGNVHCLPSSVDAEHFSPRRLAADAHHARAAAQLQSALPQPRLGFFGVIDERFDTALVDHLARERPQWQFVMVGPVVKIDPARLPRHPNLHWLGMQPYGVLPHLMAGWDACLMPFALNDSTRFISPTKTLEYLAGDKEVISTAVRDVAVLYGDAVHIASDAAGFLRDCDAVLARSPAERSQRLETLRHAVRRSSWDRSAETVHGLIETQLASAPARRPAALPAASAEAGSALRAMRRIASAG